MNFLKLNYAYLIVIMTQLFIIGTLAHLEMYYKPLNQATIIIALVSLVLAVVCIRKKVESNKATIAQ